LQISTGFRWRRPGQTRGAIGLSLIFCFLCIKAKEEAKTSGFSLLLKKPKPLRPITIPIKNLANQHRVSVAQARTNARSDRVVLDFLLLLHQGKRRDKNKQITKSEKNPANPVKQAITESIRKVVLDIFASFASRQKKRQKHQASVYS
jgi:hypothetical protein